LAVPSSLRQDSREASGCVKAKPFPKDQRRSRKSLDFPVRQQIK
jgi:hypothetical protein